MSRRTGLSRRATVRLGWRLLRIREPRRAVSLALVVVGLAVAVVSVLSAVSAYTVVGARTDRTVARAQATATDTEPATAWVDVHRQPFHNRTLLRVDIALSAAPPPPPPGVVRWPAPGEEMVSPAYRAGSATDPSLRAYAPGRDVGTVGNAGLRSPDELVVYRGVNRADLPRGGAGIVARTDQVPRALAIDTFDIPAGQLRTLIVTVLVCLGLPLLAFLSVAARLSASTRARRLAALHLLGMSPSTVRAVNAVEVALLAATGAALGLLLDIPVNTVFAGSGLVGFTWFPADTALSTTGALTVVVVTAVLAVGVSRRVDDGAGLTTVSTRRAADRSSTSPWRVVPLLLGTLVLLAVVIVGFRRAPDAVAYANLDLVMLASVGVTGLGLLWAVSPLTAIAGRLAHRRGRSLGARLGGARAAFDPAGSARLVAGLAILVFAVGVAIGQTRDARAVSEPTGATVDVTVDAQDLPSATVGAALINDTSTPAVATITTEADNPRFIKATVATCAQITRFLELAPTATSGCVDGTAYWPTTVAPSDRTLTGLPLPTALQNQLTPGSLPTALADGLPLSDVLITSPAASVITTQNTTTTGPGLKDTAGTAPASAAQITLRAPTDRVEQTLATIYTAAPYSQPTAFGVNPDSHEHLAMINGYLHLGLLGGALIALLALVAALADRATERRRADHELLAAGAPVATVAAAHGWEVALTLGVGLGTAITTGILGGTAWQLSGGLVRTPDYTAIAELVALALIVGALAVIAAATAAPRHPDAAVLRSE